MSGIFERQSAAIVLAICSFATLSLLFAPMPAIGAKPQGKTVDIPAALEVTIDNRIRMTLQPRHFYYGLGERWVVEQGKHLVGQAAEVGGRRYALVTLIRVRQPSQAHRATREPYVDESLSEKCGSVVRHYAAFDMETTVLEERTWVAADSPCEHADRWARRFNLDGLPTEFYFTKHSSIKEGEAAIAERKVREEQEQARQERLAAWRQEQQMQELQLSAPGKRQIGATVCTVRNGMGHAGYTEQVSPDTGKIRIRVIRQFDPANGRFLLSSQPEQNVWEDPDNWYICKF